MRVLRLWLILRGRRFAPAPRMTGGGGGAPPLGATGPAQSAARSQAPQSSWAGGIASPHPPSLVELRRQGAPRGDAAGNAVTPRLAASHWCVAEHFLPRTCPARSKILGDRGCPNQYSAM